MTPRPGCWNSLKIGGGAVPIKTPQGWLCLYHGVDRTCIWLAETTLEELINACYELPPLLKTFYSSFTDAIKQGTH